LQDFLNEPDIGLHGHGGKLLRRDWINIGILEWQKVVVDRGLGFSVYNNAVHHPHCKNTVVHRKDVHQDLDKEAQQSDKFRNLFSTLKGHDH
jgi:hypothetical protein